MNDISEIKKENEISIKNHKKRKLGEDEEYEPEPIEEVDSQIEEEITQSPSPIKKKEEHSSKKRKKVTKILRKKRISEKEEDFKKNTQSQQQFWNHVDKYFVNINEEKLKILEPKVTF
jgi:hypothetical protein